MKGSAELKIAVKAAEEAGRILLEGMESSKVVEAKGFHDVVLDADIKSEKAIIETIESAFPEHGIFSEETGHAGKKSGFTWIVDPLDGTRNYEKKIPIFAVSIALARGNEIVLGVVHDPSAKRMYCAEKGKGAFLDGKKMAVSAVSEISKAMVYYDVGKPDEATIEKFGRMQKAAYRIRNFGAGALALCYVALGGYGAYITPKIINRGEMSGATKIMDVAAGAVIAEEAGGKITDICGRPFNVKSESMVATNGLLHKKALEILK